MFCHVHSHCALCIVHCGFVLCTLYLVFHYHDIMDMGNLVFVCSVLWLWLCPEAGAGCRVAMPEEVEWGSEDGDGDCKLKLHTVHSKLQQQQQPELSLQLAACLQLEACNCDMCFVLWRMWCS